MKKTAGLQILMVAVFTLLLMSLAGPDRPVLKMPWKAAGLTEQQAAAHLLSRFTFGAAPGEVDAVVQKGLEKWFMEQLNGQLPDNALQQKLQTYNALGMSNERILEVFPRASKVQRMAVADSVVTEEMKENDRLTYRTRLENYMKEKGYRPEQELYRQFASQKILSAAFSRNQLHQVLTEFWFNHFNVSASKNECAQFIPAYERDVIRPRVSGKFEELLLATAQSPAMLFFLDNFNSSGVNEELSARQSLLKERLQQRKAEGNADAEVREQLQMLNKLAERRKNQGLNENYAREIMELHTLGVEGGYTQADVTEAARVLTGWTVYPHKELGGVGPARKMLERFGEDKLQANGFVRKGDFLFAANRHDTKEKKVMGRIFPAGGGYEEGVELIRMLANHPSTARFISRKLAIRFVSDEPPARLVEKMATAFTKSGGDIRQVLITLVAAPEFWKKEVLREKTKSPFELAINAVRAVNAELEQPFMVYQWITRMGQQLYYYQAPTGFPDRGQYWINTGSLLNRMKFGMAFAAQKIPGVTFNLAALNGNREPESARQALEVYSKLIMPEREVEPTLKRLEPLINDPALAQKVEQAASQPAEDSAPMQTGKSRVMSEEQVARQMFRRQGGKEAATPMLPGNQTLLAQVVGIIIGSPEFQRR